MKRATMTIPDDLAEAMEQYVQAQEVPPALTTVVQVALREYLRERGFLQPYRRLKIEPVGRSGRSDVSINHDAYRAGIKKGHEAFWRRRGHFPQPPTPATRITNGQKKNCRNC